MRQSVGIPGIRGFEVAVCLVLLAGAAEGCSCGTRKTYCEAPPDAKDGSLAVFVGVVEDVYPAEPFEAYVRKMIERFKHLRGVEFNRTMLRSTWQDEMTAWERGQLEAAESIRDLIAFMDARFFSPMPRRVRLRVTERFSGAGESSYVLFTGFGGGDCSPGFEAGESYLVTTYKSAVSGRWSASMCNGTRRVKQAELELAALRAWRRGEKPRNSVSGVVSDASEGPGRNGYQRLADFPLRLRMGLREWVTRTDQEGRFVFDGLDAGLYAVEPADSEWKDKIDEAGPIQIDLERGGCAEIHLYVKKAGGG